MITSRMPRDDGIPSSQLRFDELFFDDDFFVPDFLEALFVPDFLEAFFVPDFLDDFFAPDFLEDFFVALFFDAVFLRVRAAFFAEALLFFFAADFDLPLADPLFTVAQARRSASSSLTPFSS